MNPATQTAQPSTPIMHDVTPPYGLPPVSVPAGGATVKAELVAQIPVKSQEGPNQNTAAEHQTNPITAPLKAIIGKNDESSDKELNNILQDVTKEVKNPTPSAYTPRQPGDKLKSAEKKAGKKSANQQIQTVLPMAAAVAVATGLAVTAYVVYQNGPGL